MPRYKRETLAQKRAALEASRLKDRQEDRVEKLQKLAAFQMKIDADIAAAEAERIENRRRMRRQQQEEMERRLKLAEGGPHVPPEERYRRSQIRFIKR